MEADRKELFPGDSLEFAVTGRYLFGAPAAGLPCEVEVRLVPKPFSPPGWEGFVFADGEKKPVPYQEFLGSIVLDDEGKGLFTYEGPFADSGTLLFRAGVMEEGGRFAYKTLSLPYHPVGTYVGIRAPRDEVRTGTSVSFRIGATLPDGSPAPLGAATAEISRVIWHSVLVEEDGRYRFQGREEFVSLERSGVPLSGGEGSFAFTPREDGQYLLRVTDEEGGAAASVRFYAFGDGGTGGGSLLDQVRLSPSKTLYAEGDEARIKVEAPFAGKLLFTVETDRVLEHRVLDLATKKTEIRFPVTAAMAPNAYCTVWVVREVSETVENWSSHRALGTVRIAVDQDALRLRTLVEAPSRVRPGRSFSGSVRLEDAQGNAVPGEAALAFVDEGILGLTDFTTPDPWSFFTALRALGVQTFDLYDELLPVEGKATALLRPGGGDGEEAMMRASLSPRAGSALRASLSLPSAPGHGRGGACHDGVGNSRVQRAGAYHCRPGRERFPERARCLSKSPGMWWRNFPCPGRGAGGYLPGSGDALLQGGTSSGRTGRAAARRTDFLGRDAFLRALPRPRRKKRGASRPASCRFRRRRGAGHRRRFLGWRPG